MNAQQFQQQYEPLRSLKTKKVYDPGHLVQVTGKLATTESDGTISCRSGEGLAIYTDGSIEHISMEDMVKQREYAEKENPKPEEEEEKDQE